MTEIVYIMDIDLSKKLTMKYYLPPEQHEEDPCMLLQ
jgi:hypothetical protein